MGIKRYNVTEEDGSIQPYDVDDSYYDNFKIDHPNHEEVDFGNPIPPAIGPSPDFGKATAEEAAPAGLKKQKVAMGSVSEDGSSESEDPFSNYYVTPEDLRNSEENVSPALNKKLSGVGISTSEGTSIGGLNALNLKSSKDVNIQGPDIISRSFSDFTSAIGIGKDKTDEELAEAAAEINAYIKEKGDIDYISKAKERSGDAYEKYTEYITAPDVEDKGLRASMKKDLVSEFSRISRGERKNITRKVGGEMTTVGIEETPATVDDFKSEEEYNAYKQWKKNGYIQDFSESEVVAYDEERKRKFALDASSEYASDTNASQRIDVLALAADDEKKLTNLQEEANKFFDIQDAYENSVQEYKLNPTNDNFMVASTIELDYLREQGKIQSLQNKLKADGTIERSKSVPLALMDFNKDYNRMRQLRSSFKSLGTDIAYGAAQLSILAGSGPMQAAYLSSPALLNSVIDDTTGLVSLGQDMQVESERFQRAIQVDEINSISDAGRWVAGSTVNLIPSLSMAFAGPAAMPLFFMSGSGGKGLEIAINQKNASERMIKNKQFLIDNPNLDVLESMSLEQQMEEDAKTLNLSSWQTLGVQALYGVAEVAFERLGTMSLLKNVKNGIKMLPPTTIKEGFNFVGKQLVQGVRVEGGSEFATTVAQNFGDIFILGEDKNLFEGGLESFAQGALMGGGMNSINISKGLRQGYISVMASKAESQKLENVLQAIRKITGEPKIQGWGDVAGLKLKLPKETQDVVDALIKDMQQIEQGVLFKLGTTLSVEQAYAVEEKNRAMRLINKQLINASNNPNISPAQLKNIEAELRVKFDALAKDREALLSDSTNAKETKNNFTNTRVSLDSSLGYAYYQQSMLTSSVASVVSNYNNLSPEANQLGLDEAKEELIKLGEADPSIDAIKDKALNTYIDNTYKEKINQGRANAETFAEQQGLNLEVVSFEGKDSNAEIIAAFENAGITGSELAKLKKAVRNGSFEGGQIPGTNKVIVNMDAAVKNRRIGIFAHEILHAYAREKYKGNQKAIDLAGADLLAYLEKNDADLFARVQFRIDQSYTEKDAEGNVIKDADYFEEAMNAMSDVLADGQSVNESAMNKIRVFANSFLSGLPDKFQFKKDQGRDAYEFVKNYNKAAHFGGKGDLGNKITSNNDKPDEEIPATVKQSITKSAAASKTALDNIPYSELQSGVSQSAIGRELPGMVKAQIGRFNLSKQARQDFIDVVVAKMFIEKDTTKWGTDPKGEEMEDKGTLYGFLNGRIGWRIKDVVREEYKRNPGERIYLAGIDTNQFETLDKAANVVDEETAVKEDDKPVFKKLLPSKVISTEALVNIKNKVLSTVRTLKTAIDSKTSINRTVSPLIAEIKKEMGEQADIDLKEEMGGKKDGELQKWLITNKKAILENMTTTWLMGKGKKGKVKGGIPAAIQKRVDGTWTNNWEGKKIDRESVKVDNAGRTSGADMVRRNPNVSSMEDITFLSYFLQDIKIDKAGNIISGDPIRGRKESLAKAMAEEISLEVFNQQLEDKDSNISKAFEQNQTLKGVILADNYIAEVAKQIERGNVKFSISKKNLSIFNSNSEQILTKLREANVNMTSTILYNISKSVLGDTIEDQELKNYTSKIANHVKKYIKTINVESKVDFNNFVFEGLQLDESNSNLYKAFNFTRSQIGSLADLFNSTNVATQRGLSYAFNVKMVEEQGVEGIIKILKWLSGHQTSSGKIGDGRNQIYAGNENYIINNLRNIPNIRIEFNTSKAGVNKKGKPTKGKTTITEVYYKGVKIENLKSKITTPSQKAGDNTEKSRTKFIKEYELRKEASLEAWEVLNEYLSFVKENGNEIDWIMTMMSLKSNMSSILKAAAPVKYYYMGSYIGKLRYEHMIPTEYMVLKLTEYYWNGKKFDLSTLRDKYNVAIIPVKMDDNFNIQRRSQMRPGYDPMVDSETERYYDKGTLGYDNMYAIESLGGEDKGAIYGESWIKLSKSIDIKALNVVNTQQKAIDNGRSVKMSLSPKKIRVFDFDDTLAITDSKVLYTMPNPTTGFSPESVKQKAIFMVGGPGAGKTNVGKGLQLGRQGYKVVNQDIALEAMKKESGLPGNESDYNEGQRSTRSVLGAAAKKAAVDKFDKYAKNGDGMVIDGTGASYNATMKKVKQLEDSGYEVHMVIANTPLETALARNKARAERSLPSFIVEKTWKQVQESSELYRKDFGDRLYEINTESIEYGKALPGEFLQTVYEGINKNIAGKIDAATFAKEAGTMESLGAEWNFAEFSKIVDGKEGPLLEVAKIIADKRGTKDVFVLTARPSDAAVPIKKFLASMGLDIPIKNITGLGDGSPKAKADWITGKFAEGYNDFYFADDHTGNVKAVKDVLNALDVKSKVQQARVKFSLSLDKEFNAMIERNKGVRAETTFSDIVAKKRGKDIGRFKLWMPSSLDDFKGLTSYVFSGSGRQGDADMEFFKKALIDPYFSGVSAIETAKQTIKNDFKALNKLFKPTVKKLGDIVPGTSYTYDQAIRVSLWTKAGYEIPGISKRDLASLNAIVSKDPELSAYSDGLLLISKNDKWGEPGAFWDVNTILSDLNNMTEKAGRKTYIAEFIENVDVIFSDKNLNKIEALYGTRQRDALEDAIYRMKNGTNRPSGTNKIVNVWNNWVNNSTGAIMFFNRKSAALQLISTVNFMNWSDNNPLKAAAAFANQPQYWKDWATIFNSDKLKQRRSGLKSDVNEAEIANSAANSTNKAQAALSYLLKIGFTPTQIADSFAIASGGASFYRNRINTYKAEYIADGDKLKRKYTDKEAEEKAWKDFSQVSDETQQSSDPALISMEQASVLGRLVLTFQNTAIQLNRSIKKSSLDLYKRRRTKGLTQFQSDASNLSKVIYYGAIQNIIFTSLQAALFSLIPGFDDDDEEENAAAAEKKVLKGVNSVVDTMLKGGFGLKGAVVSTVKNMVIEYAKQEKKGYTADHTYTILQGANLSPPIGSKLSKIYGAIQTKKFDKDVINDRGFSVTIDGKVNISPSYSVLGSVVSGTTNMPLDRAITEVNSLAEAFDARNTAMQRIALGLGWRTWDVGAKNEENDLIKATYKSFKKEENKAKAKATRAAAKAEKEKTEKDRVANLSPEELLEEKRQKAIKKAIKKDKAKKTRDSLAIRKQIEDLLLIRSLKK
jgi:predicted kinase